ncbi:hypothetical protein A3G67_01295 [Candidatus Roizmanbacteria bacterium RIFCSPLOWO2_12_FULL_40_12]|uniref:Mannosylglycerate hydrolase MGH1-like glycoside hydrolase domain-containing protein n=1 Tax=Candidatus Roizmanbacteria bacterium RIFCSPLOWO2_01_FULL_40_42 TaxID=1802066 RepID=A0A1F7J542_9BACT|nr:MAG: hypothetical protein A2779_01770 [Candidatus Roizmanbacteria bacterium RIFCSPHIGHO2_01_FULL_40_98]OGK28540.1 MAG: hypothetical protein A3C31_01090 [Candidatus Roizmanbacteria bacterium RIFCSPHIGHO2_02_FULL_40_53]OGK30410.1 MAG: hypothetical protein A2W49_00825 [Candidatus Roizmanbacteria bacterium RIFCSPHIGHO2_12_41_18]OGK36559.1 MAG: hypothetical protein A3E69_03470 [Candidatus Roizmanbacteria bacterium RIFCSPHIGHO2_12_FULL_40_130]OGK50728.1 MAG: hypothetical protein A3B50_04480 [Candi
MRVQKSDAAFFKEGFHKAKGILQHNHYRTIFNGITYKRTVPSRDFYIHQWNWDSATHAMGLVHLDPARAVDELRALISGQWKNGLIPQIIFNPGETKYFPGPQFWGTEKFRKGEILSSGITQPPLLGISAEHVFKTATSQHIAVKHGEEILSGVLKYHDYLKTTRDPEDSGLLTVVHPWESGTDNSARWDKLLGKIKIDKIPQGIKEVVDLYRVDNKLKGPAQRPRQEFYYRAMYLIYLFKNLEWDYKKIVKESPFAVKDILFNCLWIRSNEALANMLNALGRKKDAERYQVWAVQGKMALEQTWSNEFKQFCDVDVSDNKQEVIVQPTNSMFAPLLAGIPDQKQLNKILVRLHDRNQFWSEYPVPTMALNSPFFDRSKYWRGPSWPITNLFIIDGLARYPLNKKASQLRKLLVEKTLRMIVKNDFSEYYDPVKGSGLGFGNFSWSAAIFIYLFRKYKVGGLN